MLPGSELTLTAQGFEGGHRNVRDGIAYFGCKKRSTKSSIRSRQGDIINDAVIKLKDKEASQLYRGRHFQIKYYPETDCYKIKDLGVGFGTFMKMDKSIIVPNNCIVMLGDSFLILNLLPDQTLVKEKASKHGDNTITLTKDNTRLKATVYAGPANGEMLYTF